MELFACPLKKYWESARSKDIAWKEIPIIVEKNTSWLGSKDIQYLIECLSSDNPEDCIFTAINCLKIVAINCPSYKKKIIKILNDSKNKNVEGLAEEIVLVLRRLAKDTLPAFSY